jgi:thymidylate kinase
MSATCKQPVTVSFSGMDGAGKSTQIEALSTRAREAGLSVRVVPFWDEVARFTSVREKSGHALFGGEKGVGSPERPIERRDKNVRKWYMSLVRLFLYSADALSLRSMYRKLTRSGADLIIFDRYAYDELVNLNLRNPFWRFYAKLVMKLVPRPGVSYVLDADPAAARARKPEYPLEFLYTCRESYLTLSRLLGGMTIIPPMPVRDVELRVLEHALQIAPRVLSGDRSEGLGQGSDLAAEQMGGQSAHPFAS